MSNKPNLDDELADFTDRLFSGGAGEVSADNMAEARLVRQLHTMMKSSSHPSTEFRTKLTQQINHEWDVVHRQQSRPVIAPRFNRNLSVIGMAAAIVTALLFVLILYPNSPLPLPGMGGDKDASIVVPFIFMGVVLIIGALLLWLRRR